MTTTTTTSDQQRPIAARRQLDFSRLADDLEAKLERTLNLRNDKIYAQFSANFDANAAEERPAPKPSAIPVAKPARKPPAIAEAAVQTAHLPQTEANCQTQPSDEEDVEATAEDVDAAADGPTLDRITRHNWRLLLAERDEHIDRLVAHLDELHSHNVRFAADNRRLQQQPRQCSQCPAHLANCQRLQTMATEQEASATSAAQDARMLKTLVYRLNVQLERHQDELRRLGAADEAFANAELAAAGGGASTATAQPSWGSVSTHTLAPLLTAYSAMLAEQRDLVAQYEQDAARFTGRLKAVCTENAELHAAMDTLRSSAASWQADRTRLEAQLGVCRGKAEVHTRRADLAKQKLVEVLRCYEQKVQAQHLELERLQEAYARANGELQAMRAMQQNPEVVVESLRECQRLFEELKRQHDADRGQLVAEAEALRARCAGADERERVAVEEAAEVRRRLRERQEEAERLGKKNVALRQSLGRVRLSREAFRTRLKQQQQMGGGGGGGAPARAQPSAPSPEDVELMMRARGLQMQREVHARYVDEIERLTRKLQQRDDTLRRVLAAKVRGGGGGGVGGGVEVRAPPNEAKLSAKPVLEVV